MSSYLKSDLWPHGEITFWFMQPRSAACVTLTFALNHFLNFTFFNLSIHSWHETLLIFYTHTHTWSAPTSHFSLYDLLTQLFPASLTSFSLFFSPAAHWWMVPPVRYSTECLCKALFSLCCFNPPWKRSLPPPRRGPLWVMGRGLLVTGDIEQHNSSDVTALGGFLW